MVQNDDAISKDDALQLSFQNSDEIKNPSILIIDESSMVGKKLFAQIELMRFKYVLFVGDWEQLPVVKDKVVNWESIADRKYQLTQNLRAKDERLMLLHHDFREYKQEKRDSLDLMDYVNDDNIVAIDYADIDILPTNTKCCMVGYRNRLVENLTKLVTSDEHTMYNLNIGVVATWMISTIDTPNENGYFPREFTAQQAFYNGEDVEIIKLGNVVDKLVSDGYTYYNQFKLSLNKKRTGITIIDTNNEIKYGQRESIEPKQFLNLPENDILENCTLSIIEGKIFSLMWDRDSEEFNDMLDYYFNELLPFLSEGRLINKYYKNRFTDISHLSYLVQENLKKMNKKEFQEWYTETENGIRKKKAWSIFLTAQRVVSARPTTSRTLHKSQGISIPCVIITDQSFYGASRAAQYVAITRSRQGIILVNNTPKSLVQE